MATVMVDEIVVGSLSFQEEVTDRNRRCSLVDLYSVESPSHDSNGSEICSPERTTENELEHDADSDSSGDEVSFFDHLKNRAKSQENRRKSRRASSNAFVTKKFDNDAKVSELFDSENICTEFVVDGLNNTKKENAKQLLCKSYSSSTDENERNVSLVGSTLQYGFPNRGESISSTSGGEDTEEMRKTKKLTAVDGLLFEIYDRFHSRGLSVIESDITECSTTSVNSVYVTSSFENDERLKVDQNFLETKGKLYK